MADEPASNERRRLRSAVTAYSSALRAWNLHRNGQEVTRTWYVERLNRKREVLYAAIDETCDALDTARRALLPDDSTPAEHPSRIRILVDTCGHKAGDEVEPITWNVNGSPWVSNRLVTNASVRLSAGQWAPAATPELQDLATLTRPPPAQLTLV